MRRNLRCRAAGGKRAVTAASLALGTALSAAAPATAQQVIVVPTGTTDTTIKNVSGADQLTVEAGGALAVNAYTAVNWWDTSTDLRITNNGAIESTQPLTGTAIYTDGVSGTTRTMTLLNEATGIIRAQNDAFRMAVNPSGGTILAQNYGLIEAYYSGSGALSSGSALDFANTGGATVEINNYSGGTIRSSTNGAAIVAGSAFTTINNAGTIRGRSSAGIACSGCTTYAISMELLGGTINNSGVILGEIRAPSTRTAAIVFTNSGQVRFDTGGSLFPRWGSITLDGNFNDQFYWTGGTVGAVNMGAGDDYVEVSTGAVFTGPTYTGLSLTGGTGTDMLRLTGSGLATLTGTVSGFETMEFASGNWTVAGMINHTGQVNILANLIMNGVFSAGVRFTIANGVSVTTTTNGYALFASNLDNSGTVSNSNSTGQGIYVVSNGVSALSFVNRANGLIESRSTAIEVAYDPSGGSIALDNYGIIRTLDYGATAIDWRSIASSKATTSITNRAGATIWGAGAGIRPGTGTVITNAGTIVGGGSNCTCDGIEWIQRIGTVDNQSTGAITGFRYGVSANVDLNVTNHGTIEARNGAAIFSAWIGTVTNYGTLRGTWDGSATGVDGDGAYFRGTGTVRNWGTILGLFSTGGSTSEGVKTRGGLIENAAGALIYGDSGGILVGFNDSYGNGAFAATTVTNAGTIASDNGPGIHFVGNYADTVTNSGYIGGSGLAVDLGDGNDRLRVFGGASFVGTMEGGAGTDELELYGGNGHVPVVSNFEVLNISGGGWHVFNPATYSGGAYIDYSVAVLHAHLTAAMTVRNGGHLAGSGSMSSLNVLSAGTVSPGELNIGTFTVIGSFTQQAGTTYVADIPSAGGLADRILVSGTASLESGAQLLATRDAGSYTIGTQYLVLSAGGGITGSYTLGHAGPGDAEFRLVQDATTIKVEVARTRGSLARIGLQAGMGEVAASLASLGASNSAYSAITLLAAPSAVQESLGTLSGGVYASLAGRLVQAADTIAESIPRRSLGAARGPSWWVQSFGSNLASAGSPAGATRAIGMDVGLGSATRVGFVVGSTRADLQYSEAESACRVEGSHIQAYVDVHLGPAVLHGSIGHFSGLNQATRDVSVGALSERMSARYRSDVTHAHAELRLPLALGGFLIEPYASFSGYRVGMEGFSETTGAAALRAESQAQTFLLASTGARAEWTLAPGLRTTGRLGWQIALGTEHAVTRFGFAAGGPTFRVTERALARNTFTPALALSWQRGQRMAVGLSYSGQVSSLEDDHRLQLSSSLRF